MSPPLAAAVARDWGLKLGEPYPPGAAGYVVPAELEDGTPAVLKLQHSHREDEQEADALERWDGDGAIRLLARDDERHALLLERCEPGTPLSRDADDPLGVLIELLPRLWKDATGFRTLADESAWWLEQGDLSRMSPGPLRDAAVALARELAPTQGELVLVHQDLHGDNVLAAEREPWLVIDPKPLAAEREFAVAPIVRSRELGHSRRDVLHRLDRLSAELGLDRERARGWTIVHTAAWLAGEGAAGRREVIEWLS
ncbi:MAG TPA: aminoglycoside phosphotransferase family protein [Gaiellaceae bacterium]|nr:aminoglycoside phosphotransferase family protein [Gaiellaceae bacterium]